MPLREAPGAGTAKTMRADGDDDAGYVHDRGVTAADRVTSSSHLPSLEPESDLRIVDAREDVSGLVVLDAGAGSSVDADDVLLTDVPATAWRFRGCFGGMNSCARIDNDLSAPLRRRASRRARRSRSSDIRRDAVGGPRWRERRRRTRILRDDPPGVLARWFSFHLFVVIFLISRPFLGAPRVV